MEKINYDLVLQETIKKLDYKPKLLLHACCGPCSSYVLEYLNSYFDISIYYYNPNIYPEEEFIRRKEEAKKFNIDAKYNLNFIEEIYEPNEYYSSVKDCYMLGERSKRCYNCYKLRLEKCCKYAKEHGFDYFTTTLSISPYKNSNWINEIGITLEKEYGIKFLRADFKKKNGYKRSLELSKEYNLYRQEYCGCIYSKKEREIYVKSKENN